VNTPGVYIIELDEPLCTRRRAAKFYLGSAKNIAARIEHYRVSRKINRNSFLTEAKRRGISWRLVYIIPTQTPEKARQLEAKMKRKKRSGRQLMQGGIAV